jgi:hypothetical protein
MKFINGSVLVCAAVGVLGASQSAFSQQIFDPNLITLRHDFDTLPPSAPPPGPFSLGIATFSESSTGTGGPGWRLITVWPGLGRQLTDNAGISNILVSFSAPQLRVGMNVGIGNATYQVQFFNGASVVGTVSQAVVGTAANFFAGWQNAGGITSVRITEPTGENGLVGGIDNVRYTTVPEPATLAALGLGLVALLRRRKK